MGSPVRGSAFSAEVALAGGSWDDGTFFFGSSGIGGVDGALEAAGFFRVEAFSGGKADLGLASAAKVAAPSALASLAVLSGCAGGSAGFRGARDPPLGQPALALRIDLAEDFSEVRRVGIGRVIGAQFVEYRPEFDPLRLGHGPLQPRHDAGRDVLVGHQIENVKRRHSAGIDGDGMPAQGRLDHVGHGEAGRAVELLQPLDRRAQVLFPLVFQVEIERCFEDGVQQAFDAVGGGTGVRQAGHDFRQLGNGRNPDLVPIEKRVHHRREGLFRRIAMGVFQAASKQQVLDHRAPRVDGRRLVVLLQHLVDFGELGGTTDGGHGDGSLRSWSAGADDSSSAAVFSGGRTCCRICATAIDRLTP